MTHTPLLDALAEVLHGWRALCAAFGAGESVVRDARDTLGVGARFLGQALGEARALAAARRPDQVIERVARPYLERWWLERTADRAVYVHRWLGDDPDLGLHDHPADSASLCLGGELRELWMPAGDLPDHHLHDRRLRPGAVCYRSAAHAHQLRIVSEAEPWTLFVFGPRAPDAAWGFWVPSPDGTRKVRHRHPSPSIHPPQEPHP